MNIVRTYIPLDSIVNSFYIVNEFVPPLLLLELRRDIASSAGNHMIVINCIYIYRAS